MKRPTYLPTSHTPRPPAAKPTYLPTFLQVSVHVAAGGRSYLPTYLPTCLPAYILERSRCNVAMAASDGRTASGSRSIVFFMRRLSEGGVDESDACERVACDGKEPVVLGGFQTYEGSRSSGSYRLKLGASPLASGSRRTYLPTYLPTYPPRPAAAKPTYLPTYLSVSRPT